MVIPDIDRWLLGLARVLPIVVLHPIFGGAATPRAVKVAVAAALAGVAMPHASGSIGHGADAFALAVAGQLAVGATIGVIGQAVFGAIEAAGRLVDDARGANVARSFAPQLEAAASPLGQLELNAAIALYWGAGLHAGLVSAVMADGASIPIAGAPTLGRGALDVWCAAAGTLARAGLAIAGPAVVACVVVDALMGIVNRSAPGANVFALGLPLKLAAAALVTAVGLPHRAARWAELWASHEAWLRSVAVPVAW